MMKDSFNYGKVKSSDDYFLTIKHPTRRLILQIRTYGGHFNTITPKVYDGSDTSKRDLFENTHPNKDIKVDKQGKINHYSLEFHGSDIKIDRNFGFEFSF